MRKSKSVIEIELKTHLIQLHILELLLDVRILRKEIGLDLETQQMNKDGQ